MKHLRWLLAGALCIGVLVVLISRSTVIPQGDPDRYYHLALARETVQSHKLWMDKLPQFTGLGWERQFPDKEFLFHLATRGLHALGGADGGDAAVLKIVPIASSLILLSLFAISAMSAGPVVAGLLVTLGLTLDPYLLLRLGMLRPHLFAILFFTLLLHGLVRKSPWIVAISCALYTWSYHAFYLPMVVMGAFWLVGQGDRVLRSRIAVWGVLGLLVGMIINPHFPGNFLIGLRCLLIAAFEAGKSQLDFGVELIPWSTDRFIRTYLPFLVVMLGATLHLGASRKRSELAWIWVSTGVFFVLAALNPRGIEYAVPLGILLFSRIIARDVLMAREVRILLAVLAVAAIPRVLVITGTAQELARSRQDRVPGLLAALSKVPKAEAKPGSKPLHFYNVEWDASPYVYYTHPEFEQVDLLDPSLLESYDSRHHKVRWELRTGEVPDPWGVVQSLAGSRYLLTRYAGLKSQLAVDPHFKLLASSGEDAVYELVPRRDPHFVMGWKAAVRGKGTKVADAEALGLLPGATYEQVQPMHEHPERAALGFELPPVPWAFLDLRFGGHLPRLGLPFANELKSKDPQGVTCVQVEPDEASRRLQIGRDVIAIGGGRSIRIWLNQKKLYRTIAASDSVGLMGQLVQVGRKLTASDRIQMLVCSRDSAKTMGVSLSFWTEAEIDATCRERGWKEPEAKGHESGWPVIGKFRQTCFGSYVRP